MESGSKIAGYVDVEIDVTLWEWLCYRFYDWRNRFEPWTMILEWGSEPDDGMVSVFLDDRCQKVAGVDLVDCVGEAVGLWRDRLPELSPDGALEFWVTRRVFDLGDSWVVDLRPLDDGPLVADRVIEPEDLPRGVQTEDATIEPPAGSMALAMVKPWVTATGLVIGIEVPVEAVYGLRPHLTPAR